MPKKKSEYALLKDQFIEMYGWVCACCGESNPAFLTLDHVKNDGTEHRNKHTHVRFEEVESNGIKFPRFLGLSTNRVALMKEVLSEYRPDRYRILCYNCNFGRAHNGGLCPHKRESPDLKAYRRKGR